MQGLGVARKQRGNCVQGSVPWTDGSNRTGVGRSILCSGILHSPAAGPGGSPHFMGAHPTVLWSPLVGSWRPLLVVPGAISLPPRFLFVFYLWISNSGDLPVPSEVLRIEQGSVPSPWYCLSRPRTLSSWPSELSPSNFQWFVLLHFVQGPHLAVLLEPEEAQGIEFGAAFSAAAPPSLVPREQFHSGGILPSSGETLNGSVWGVTGIWVSGFGIVPEG